MKVTVESDNKRTTKDADFIVAVRQDDIVVNGKDIEMGGIAISIVGMLTIASAEHAVSRLLHQIMDMYKDHGHAPPLEVCLAFAAFSSYIKKEYPGDVKTSTTRIHVPRGRKV